MQHHCARLVRSSRPRLHIFLVVPWINPHIHAPLAASRKPFNELAEDEAAFRSG